MEPRTTAVAGASERGRSVPILFVLAGLPGVGKSTLGRGLAVHRRAVYLRIDTIEQALRDLCALAVTGEGYRLAYRVAADNLRLGRDVVADCCDPWELTREEWERAGREAGATVVHVEVVCSDRAEHRRRVEERWRAAPATGLPTWADVEARDYHPFARPRVVVDTAGVTAEEALRTLRQALGPDVDSPAERR